MKRNAILSFVFVLLCTLAAVAQKPFWDTLYVNLRQPTYVGDKLLQPGEYRFEQLREPSDTKVLKIMTPDQKEVTTTGPANRAQAGSDSLRDTPDKSWVELQPVGNGQYFLHRIFVQGDLQGYEFPPSDTLKSRIQENKGEPLRVDVKTKNK